LHGKYIGYIFAASKLVDMKNYLEFLQDTTLRAKDFPPSHPPVWRIKPWETHCEAAVWELSNGTFFAEVSEFMDGEEHFKAFLFDDKDTAIAWADNEAMEWWQLMTGELIQ